MRSMQVMKGMGLLFSVMVDKTTCVWIYLCHVLFLQASIFNGNFIPMVLTMSLIITNDYKSSNILNFMHSTFDNTIFYPILSRSSDSTFPCYHLDSGLLAILFYPVALMSSFLPLLDLHSMTNRYTHFSACTT